ncbi:hypothetical protein TRFO_36398 [Tritrichomonas foetus]|uniref:E3 ubiquitin-protein ligase n=1 Tax=Tritrichomonas foetus TaxID=1144522 RepID=A0A1J4JE58_9EUKA|nr:hypothetical protein TRFO_36398 [Tritrichomonas foetus]|eukprot:OHS97392.1 hypothetical protein TRFO_36398 [Tritrichomonas foetus]
MSEIIADLHNRLKSLFLANPSKGITEAQNSLMKPKYHNFSDFINNVKKTQKSGCCVTSWEGSQLHAKCLDCQLEDNSCICIPCFLAGNHDKHHSFILGSSGSGNCDCGDPNFWKTSGNCSHHPGPEHDPDISQMEDQTRKRFITTFSAAFYACLKAENPNNAKVILNWIETFIPLGDGLRRCVSKGILANDHIMIINKFKNSCKIEDIEKKVEIATAIIHLFGKLVSDRVFNEEFGYIILNRYLELKKFIFNESFTSSNEQLSPLVHLLSFSFHFFNKQPLVHAMKTYNFSWVDFILQNISLVIDHVKNCPDYFKARSINAISELWYLFKLLGPLSEMESQKENMQKFLNLYADLLGSHGLLQKMGNPKIPMDDSDNYSFLSYILMSYLSQINSCFSNRKYNISSVFKAMLKFINSTEKKSYSVFSGKEIISPCLPLHHLFYTILSSYDDIPSVLTNLCLKNKISLDEFCLRASLYPIFYLAAIFMNNKFLKFNRFANMAIRWSIDDPLEYLNHYFCLIQVLLGTVKTKEIFISNIVRAFGVFDQGYNDFYYLIYKDSPITKKAIITGDSKSTVADAAIFIMCLLTDRSIISGDKLLYKRLRVISLLKEKKATAQEIEEDIHAKLNDPIFCDDILSYTERVTNSNGSYFKLTNDDEFTLFFPFMPPSRRNFLLSKTSDKLITFHEIQPLPFHLSFDGVFQAPVIIALIYECLLHDTLSTVQVGLCLFVLATRLNINQLNINTTPVLLKYKTFDNLVDNINQLLPNFLAINFSYDIHDSSENLYSDNEDTLFDDQQNNAKRLNYLSEISKFFEKTKNSSFWRFNSFIKDKMQKLADPNNKSKKNEITLIELVQMKKELGADALERTPLPAFLKPKIEEKVSKSKKEYVNNLKKKLITEFQVKRDKFGNNEPEEVESELCSICQTESNLSILGYPCFSITSMFPSIIENQLHNLNLDISEMEPVKTLGICLHQIHLDCIGSNSEYRCSIDRGFRNCLLPQITEDVFQDDKPKISAKLDDAIQQFLDKAYPSKKLIDILKSFAGLIKVLEVRHRSRPECLDNQKVPVLLSNLFKAIYCKMHGSNVIEDLTDPLIKLVYFIVNSQAPRIEFSLFVKQISNDLTREYLYEFLRRAAIIEDIALNFSKLEQETFIDWDEILSFENLTERYEINIFDLKNYNKNNENRPINFDEELPIFTTIPLADKFVGLYQEPYNYDIFDSSAAKFVDLFTGDIVEFTKDESQQTTKLPHFNKHAQKYHGGTVVLFSITGPNASQVVLKCEDLHSLTIDPGFYVDQFGDTDQGLKRGAMISLSKDKLENLIEKVLSNEIIVS